jgi:hypothetical protein
MRNAFDFWEKLQQWQKDALVEIEKKYGDNRWWESSDPKTIIYHQQREPFMVVSFPDYRDLLENYLGTPVCELDFAYHKEKLNEQCNLAIKRDNLGIMQSEEQIETARREFNKRVSHFVKTKFNNAGMIIESSEELPDIDNNGFDRTGYDGWLQPE